ncbi:MAG: hypothetical protein GEU73_07005 [Chloroflexi bacterium]|nr:hypothetical protein [Chloroflexota bacterium]
MSTQQPLLTRAERSGYEETSLHEDVLQFVREVSQRAPDVTHLGSMGVSAEGRTVPFVVLSGHGAFTPQAARRLGRPIVMVNANIHGGEVEGKEALLAFMRDMAVGNGDGVPPLRPLLDGLTLVLIPILNPDGNDRISTANRQIDLENLEGQIGPPTGVGTRNTGEGWNLNRDYMKQEAVESHHLARLYGQWRPHVFVDCHTTDGSIHAYDLTFDTAHTPTSGHPGPIEYARSRLLPAVADAVLKYHGRRGCFYGNYRDQNNPSSGWETYPGLPRFGSHYRGLTGRLDILLETYSYIDFRARVDTMSAFLLEIFRYVAAHGDEVMAVADQAEKDTIARGKNPRPDDLVGINYGVARRAANGSLEFNWPVYHLEDTRIVAFDRQSISERRIPGRRVVTYRAPHYARFIPTISVPRPYAYLVTTAGIGLKLSEHNIEWSELAEPVDIDVEAYVVLASEKTVSPDICSGIERFETVLSVRKERRRVRAEPGTLVVPTAQRLGNLVVYLLEPESDDGLARWEFFDRDVHLGAPFPVYRVPEPVRIPTQSRRRQGARPGKARDVSPRPRA